MRFQLNRLHIIQRRCD